MKLIIFFEKNNKKFIIHSMFLTKQHLKIKLELINSNNNKNIISNLNNNVIIRNNILIK